MEKAGEIQEGGKGGDGQCVRNLLYSVIAPVPEAAAAAAADLPPVPQHMFACQTNTTQRATDRPRCASRRADGFEDS